MKLHAFQCGGGIADKAWFDPFDADVGTKVYDPWSCYVLRHEQGIVLLDTGVHPEVLSDPATRLGAGADMFELRIDQSQTIVAELKSIGLTTQDVSHVVLSHLHLDHACALSLFRHARIHVQRKELEFARSPAIYQRDLYIPSHFEGDYDWHELEGDHDLFGDGKISLFPAPGHTPGHQCARVALECGVVLLIFDATYHISKMRQRLLPAVVWSPDAMVASWELIEQLENTESGFIIASHDPELDRVRWAPEAYYE